MLTNLAPKQLQDRIERFAPSKKYREEREDLYKEIKSLGEGEWYVLAAILFAYQGRRAREAERSHDDWYWQQRQRIERALEEIANDDLVRAGPDIESVVFYEPHEVDCLHKRRAKRCAAIRGKLETLQLVRKVLATNKLQAHNALRRRMKKRAVELVGELRELDRTVNPSRAKLADFCASGVREPVDARARAEVGGSTWRPPGEPGRPQDGLRDYLLETVGKQLRQLGRPYRQASKVIAKILVYCFDRQADVEDLTEAVERTWRKQRVQGGEPGGDVLI